MARETELKLSLRASDLPRLLAHPLLQVRPAARRLLNTYYDTPALDLMRERIALRERRIGRRTWLTVKTAGSSAGGLSQRQEWEAPTRAGTLDVGRLVTDSELASQLQRLRPRLVPLFHTDFGRRTWVLEHRQSRIEVALDQGEIRTGGSGQTRRLPLLELELELLDGHPADLIDLAHTLSLGSPQQTGTGIWMYPDDRSKAERGLHLFTGERLQPASPQAQVLDAQAHPRQAWRDTAWSCLAQLQANTGALLQHDFAQGLPDPEFIHQARVALRRLRTGLRLFAPWLPGRFARHWSGTWQTLARQLGEARNWDVLATEGLPGLLGETPPTDALRWTAWVEQRRTEANRQVVQALTDPRHTQQLLAFMHAVLSLPAPGPRAHARTDAWASRSLMAPHRRLVQQARHALQAGPEARHALRIAVKRLRYAVGFLGALAPAALARRGLPRLTRAQEWLGQLNDLDQARLLLTDHPVADPAPLLRVLEARMASGLERLPRLERQLLRIPGPRRG
ncbi:MAG TPA: CYTH and CHAD domain-containing protein [Hydrogenophaga sp.]|mgnify:CR=1 FL=1|uniref:CYTH and CHAD domain-containing protein n=1 Tax=Hydrogenophaga sp. TaxID=1904254 RepID=UPI002C5526BE|nr:CYTH and CHAD domain-containing protein [Hydrogenophaga sp.]HMN93265.1 CYTH and CHAD domain-containing protein [Hydrogenophaga sp.]HMP10828.1 CYTH and CHAD domain-containing protein [Hydrogenophaga sp.]